MTPVHSAGSHMGKRRLGTPLIFLLHIVCCVGIGTMKSSVAVFLFRMRKRKTKRADRADLKALKNYSLPEDS
jgi:hypothetical protein